MATNRRRAHANVPNLTGVPLSGGITWASKQTLSACAGDAEADTVAVVARVYSCGPHRCVYKVRRRPRHREPLRWFGDFQAATVTVNKRSLQAKKQTGNCRKDEEGFTLMAALMQQAAANDVVFESV